MTKKKPTLEDLLSTFIAKIWEIFNKNKARLDNMDTRIVTIGETMKSLEVQVG